MDIKREDFEVIGIDTKNADTIVRPSLSFGQDAWRRFKQNKVAMISAVILLIIVLLSIFAPMLSPHAFDGKDIPNKNKFYMPGYFFGTDHMGRDLWTRVWLGGRVSLTIGIVGAFFIIVFGTLYGGIAGYLGGTVDTIMMRIAEIISSIPYMLLVIMFSMILERGIVSIIIAVVVASWVNTARLVRGQILQLKEQDYVLAAIALGASPMRIIIKHLIPNVISILIVTATLEIPSLIFAEAFLSFVGIGIPPPQPSWGVLLSDAQKFLQFYPYQLFYPALALALTMLSFNLMGDGLRDALDPKLRQ